MPDYNEYVQQMERIMIKHFANQDFSLQDMYKSPYQRDYARTLFKREMKCTPVQFLTRLRLRSACDQFLAATASISASRRLRCALDFRMPITFPDNLKHIWA